MAKLTAATADRHWLYEQSVQDVEWEVNLMQRRYTYLRGRRPLVLREDFCGTAALCRQWVNRGSQYRAIGVDWDGQVLDWARRQAIPDLGQRSRQIRLIHDNVLAVAEKADIVAAFNFSYFIFKTRDELREYFAWARRCLKRDGIFMCDVYGGSEAEIELEEPRKYKGFTYIWDQHAFNPITHEAECRIHFKFKDKTRLDNAFVYHWRLWSIPEIRELLTEAGFSRVDVYWQCTDAKTGEFNGTWRRTVVAENTPGWIAYIVAAD